MNTKVISKLLEDLKAKAETVQEDSEEIDISYEFFHEADIETIRKWYLRDAYGDEFGPYNGLDERIEELNQRISESVAAFRFFAEKVGMHLSAKICEQRTEPETLSILKAYRMRVDKASHIHQAGVSAFNAIWERIKSESKITN